MAPLSPVVPSWRLPILPSLGAAVVASEPRAPAMSREQPAVGSAVPAPASGADRAPTLASPAAVPTSPPDRTFLFVSGRPSPLAGLAFGLWAIGSAGTIGWLLFGLARARGLARRAHRAEGQSWDRLRGDLEERVGLRREITLLTSAEVDTPVTWGWLRPVVLMPSEAAAWCLVRRRLALAHEMAHIRRNDWLAQMLAHVACSVYWFVPMAWMARRRMRLESEKACDESVVELGTRPSEYASHLLEMSESLQPGPLAAVATLTTRHRSQVEARIMSILSFKRPIARKRLVLTAALAGMAGLILPVSSVIPWEDPRPSGGAPARRGAAESGESTPMPSAPEPSAPSAEAPEDPEPAIAPEPPAEPIPEASPEVEAAYEAALAAWSATVAEVGYDRWLTWSHRDVQFAVRIAGRVDLNEDGHIIAMEPGASMVLKAVTPDDELHLEIAQPEGGAPLRVLSVNGLRRPFDEAAARWMTSMLAVAQARDGTRQLLQERMELPLHIGALEKLRESLRAPMESAHLEQGAELDRRLAEMWDQEISIRGRIAELRSRQEALRAAAAGMREQLESLPRIDEGAQDMATDEASRASEQKALALEDQLRQLEDVLDPAVQHRVLEMQRALESLQPQQLQLERQIQSFSQDQGGQKRKGQLREMDLELQRLHERAAALEAMAAAYQDERVLRLSEELQRLTEQIGRDAGMEL